MEPMETESSLDVLSRAASLIETREDVKPTIIERCDNESDSGYEDTFTPKPKTLLLKAMEHEAQSQEMDLEEAKEQVVFRRRRNMKSACTQTFTGEQPNFPPRPVSGPPPLLCVSPRNSMYEEIQPQQRTSVITSTHSQRRPHTIVGVPFGFSCPPPQSVQHRREVKSLPSASGQVDSGVDEHFRRSLGAEYDDFNLSTGSVDNHFALSLGDTYYTLGMDNFHKENQNS